MNSDVWRIAEYKVYFAVKLAQCKIISVGEIRP